VLQQSRLLIVLVAGLVFVGRPAAAQPNAGSAAPADWAGTWYGTLTNHPVKPGAPVVDVRRDIGGIPATDGTCTTWKTTYSENFVPRQVKDYRLCRGTGADDLFIDEGNGVRLSARWIDGVLVSMFTVDATLLVATTRLRGNVLEEEIVFANHTPATVGVQSLAPRGIQRLALYREPDWENTKSPSSTGCDAWFASGGRSEAGRYESTFTLTNQSTSPDCLARRVTIWMQSPVAREALKLTTPPGWTLTILPCPGATTVCGWTWHHNDGVPPKAVVRGFALVYHAPARLRVWQVEVGPRRVGMPYGYVGGLD
jgi:hypothetical protein